MVPLSYSKSKTGGGFSQYGATIDENNFLGTGTKVSAEILNRKENNIGWQSRFELAQRRFFRTDFSLYAQYLSNKFRNSYNFSFAKQYLSLDDNFSYGLSSDVNDGNEFIYLKAKHILTTIDEKKVDVWFSRAWFGVRIEFSLVFLDNIIRQIEKNQNMNELSIIVEATFWLLINF
jgi:hypothetical protein